jgi:CRISPR-associated protein Csx14
MPILYIATLGERAQAITVALDRLREHIPYARVAILHTARTSRIADARERLEAVLAADYPGLPVFWHEITFDDGSPLQDIDNQRSAEAYHRAVLQTLHDYKRDGFTLHLMVAGGRKAMSIYAMLAAMLIFEQGRDRVFTVLSSDELLKKADWHIPSGMREQVQVVDMPLLTARLAPSAQVNPQEILERRLHPRDDFLNHKLTPRERELADMLLSHPDVNNRTLADLLHKDIKTVETQLSSIYDKMKIYFDNGERIGNKRLALIQLLTREG